MTFPEYPIDVGILSSYFILIFFLLYYIYPQLARSLQQCRSTWCVLFLGLAGASFIATWSYMFAYFAYSYLSWKTYYGVDEPFSLDLMSLWLHNVTLFDDAWRTVCTGDWAWLWSIQLCTFTVAVWTPIIAIEGYRRQIPHVWAYMVFGQVVAISTSSALFFAVLLSYQQITIRSTKTPTWTLIAMLFLVSIGGLITVNLTPSLTSSDQFLPNLLIMHGLLLLPLIYLAINIKYLPLISPAPQTHLAQGKDRAKSIAIISLYMMGSLANLYLISKQWMKATDTLNYQSPVDVIIQLMNVFLQHPAQSSISSDVICVYIISMAWMAVTRSSRIPGTFVYTSILLTPLLSPSVSLPLYLALDEYYGSVNTLSTIDADKAE